LDFGHFEPGVRAAVDVCAENIGARMIIVGGAPRSGTTITQAVLDSHPHIFGGPEFDRLSEIAQTRTRLIESLQAGRIVEFCDRDSIDTSFGRLIESLLYPAMYRRGADYISEKTPGNVLEFEALLDILPAARFVEVVRDPRAVVSSMLAVAERYRQRGLEPLDFIASLEVAVDTVRKSVAAGYAAYMKSPERVFRLKYEDLVRKTGTATRDLFEFLGVSWHPSVQFPGRSPHPAMDSLRVADAGLWDGVGGIFDIFPTSLDGWREGLDPHQQWYVDEAFRTSEPHLSLGYVF
jgi:hypothetical protein